MSAVEAALGKIQLAIDRLGSSYPLHAGILSQWRIEPTTEVETMGIGYRDNRLTLVYSEEFVLAISLNDLTGVLHHEVNHVLFEHVFHKPLTKEDPIARTIAQEVTVNEWVPETLPLTPVTLDQFPYLPANETTEKRYRRLRKRNPASSTLTRKTSDQEKSGANSPSRSGQPMTKTDPDQGNPHRQNQGAKTSNGVNSKASGDYGQLQQSSSNGVPTVDDHSLWAEIRGDQQAAEAAAKLDIALAWGNLDERQRDKVEDIFAQIAEDASTDTGLDASSNLAPGNQPGTTENTLEAGSAQVPWQVVLRRYIGRLTTLRPVFGRPPRRFPSMAGIMPGKGRFAQKPKVMAVIDTSGSMSPPMLEDISAELSKMAHHVEVVVVESDAAIQRVYSYRPIKTVHGGGGTDFRPPLDPEFLRTHRADLVIFFTDGYGPAPDQSPPLPVIWCISSDGQKPVPWGQEIRLCEPNPDPEALDSSAEVPF